MCVCVCVCQVYKARLQDGSEIAVKIQRPGILQVVKTDYSNLTSWNEWLKRDQS